MSEQQRGSGTWMDCYRYLRRDGHGRAVSVILAFDLRKITKMDHVEGLSDPEKWSDTTNDE